MKKKNTLRLLLIEDNPGDADLVKEYLFESQIHDFEVVHEIRVKDALKTLDEQVFDIILSDVGLPDIVGINTFRKLHYAAINTALVFMTGTIPDEEAAIEALKEGAQDYLVKGQFTSDLLLRSIRYAIERKKSEIEKNEWIKREQEARKQTEIEKDKLKLEVSERKKLEKQKDDFIGIASHELKTPVTSIKSYNQVLQLRFLKEENIMAVELLSKMNAQIDKLTNLIADLLDVTKIESGKLKFNKTYFDFRELAEEIVEEIQRTTENHLIKLESEKSKTIWGDRERIGQVITNFLSNAIKYSPQGKMIKVKACFNNKSVTLFVQDFGVGIPEDAREKVFDRFFRVGGAKGNTYPGLGLGLYISSEIVKRHNGKIWVESEYGKGSKFCFTLPLEEAVIKI